MGNCSAVPTFRNTNQGARRQARRSTVSSVTNGTQLPLPKRESYTVAYNITSLTDSPLWIAIKNRRKRKPQTNRIKTTRYNIITFIPRNLFDQFHRVANIYFAILIGLNWVPSINAVSKNVSIVILFAE